MMKLHKPTYLGGEEVEINTDGLSPDEEVVGWINDYGTIISSKANVRIGDIVEILGEEGAVLIMMRDI